MDTVGRDGGSVGAARREMGRYRSRHSKPRHKGQPGIKKRITVTNECGFYDSKFMKLQVYRVDFVIVCAGMYSDYPNIPEFPPGKGPEAFQGKVMHSMEYSAMDHENAVNSIKGKRVAVVGFQKSGMDITMECSAVNGEIEYYKKISTLYEVLLISLRILQA